MFSGCRDHCTVMSSKAMIAIRGSECRGSICSICLYLSFGVLLCAEQPMLGQCDRYAIDYLV